MNITTATFKKGTYRTTAAYRWQYDKGQILVIKGLDLPEVFEVDFSNTLIDGEAEPHIGSDNRVGIPDKYLKSGDPVYAFIYLHQGEDDGETVYRIEIPVEKRPLTVDPEEPDAEEQSLIDEYISMLQLGIEGAHYAEERAWDAYDAIAGMGVSADTIGADEEASVELRREDDGNRLTMNFKIPRGQRGDKGDTGAVYTPNISADGTLSWTNDYDLENPDSFNVVEAVLAALPAAEGGRF